jgi:hypothetical protein
MSTTHNDAICQLLQSAVQLQEAPRPDLQDILALDEKGEPLFPAGVDLFKLPDTPLRRLARTRGLTLMRHKTTFQMQARIVIGGKLQGFSGLYPGVVEVAWCSVKAKRPLYLAGLFGGASQAVIDLLLGRDRPEIANPLLGSQAMTHETILQIARQRGLSVIDTGDFYLKRRKPTALWYTLGASHRTCSVREVRVWPHHRTMGYRMRRIMSCFYEQHPKELCS